MKDKCDGKCDKCKCDKDNKVKLEENNNKQQTTTENANNQDLSSVGDNQDT
jgi:hypothetical protein